LETDTSNPDVLSLVGNIPMQVVEGWGEYTGWESVARLASASVADVAVLNSKAGDITAFESLLRGQSRSSLSVEDWDMAKNELTDLLRACGRQVVYMHVMRREPINVQLALEVLPWLPDDVCKVAVRNLYYGRPEDFVHWETSSTRQLWLARGGFVLDWPAATDMTMLLIHRLATEAPANPVNLEKITDYDLITGRVLLDTAKLLPIGNPAMLRKQGANDGLVTSLVYFEHRINAAVASLEKFLQTKEGTGL